MLTDSHVHLNRSEFQGDRAEVLTRAGDAGITRLLNVGYDLTSSRESLALADSDPRIYATVGVHPHDAATIADNEGRVTAAGQTVLSELAELTNHGRVVAIGEIGLDFFRDLSPRPAQKTALRLQLELAARVRLPVVFHIRNAYAETLALVDEVGVPRHKGVLHAFQGDLATLTWAVQNGFKLGIGGPVTYPKSHLSKLLSHCLPSDLLLETDAPWLPPVPYRGKRNEPAWLHYTAEKVAEIYGMTLAELAQLTSQNFTELFHCADSGPKLDTPDPNC